VDGRMYLPLMSPISAHSTLSEYEIFGNTLHFLLLINRIRCFRDG
jgi:hypothetical protein